MNDKNKVNLVLEFIKGHNLGVLATVNRENKPEAAVIGFSETDDFEILFATFESSRKYSNLKKDGNVALVVGWDQGKTVQLEGLAEEITDPAKIENFKRVHMAKIPTAIKWLGHNEERFFSIKPRWARFTDLAVDPFEIFEINF